MKFGSIVRNSRTLRTKLAIQQPHTGGFLKQSNHIKMG